MKEYYSVLGVKPTASIGEIQSAYKAMSLKYHPDKNRDRDTTRKFQEISEAYQVLGDYHERRAYDNDREQFQFQEMEDPFDMFESFNRSFTSHFKNIIDMDFPDFEQGMTKNDRQGGFYSYSSSSSTNFNPKEGGYQTRRVTQINENGKKQNLVEKVYQDQDGRVIKHIHSHPSSLPDYSQPTYVQTKLAMGPKNDNPKYPKNKIKVFEKDKKNTTKNATKNTTINGTNNGIKKNGPNFGSKSGIFSSKDKVDSKLEKDSYGEVIARYLK